MRLRRKSASPDTSGVPLRLRQRGMSPLRAGLLVVLFIIVATYASFSKHNPLHHGFQLKAVFSSAVNVSKNSPVRIAGVTVGKVQSISDYSGSTAALVTMSLNNDALPLHTDATLKIRPRIFLEGNFFVDLTPGSPAAPTLSSGGTIPITQTADPVQLDQVLSALNSDTRSDLQELLASYGTALTHVPTAAQDRTQDPIVRGKTAAQALNEASLRAPNALRNSAIVAQALGGQQTHDVSRLVASLGKVTGALGQSDGDLQGLISNFDLTLQALATQSAALNSAVAVLPSALTTADEALVALDEAFPATRTFANDLAPAVQEAPSTITAALPWISEARELVTPAELGGLAKDLVAAAPALGALVPTQQTLAHQIDPVSRCLSKVIFPGGDVPLSDGTRSTGVRNYQEFWYGLVGLNGVGSAFDGNGSFQRLLLGGGGQSFTTGPVKIYGTSDKGTSQETLQGRETEPSEGTSPAAPAAEPPVKSNVACATQSLPDYNGPASHGAADGSLG